MKLKSISVIRCIEGYSFAQVRPSRFNWFQIGIDVETLEVGVLLHPQAMLQLLFGAGPKSVRAGAQIGSVLEDKRSQFFYRMAQSQVIFCTVCESCAVLCACACALGRD